MTVDELPRLVWEIFIGVTLCIRIFLSRIRLQCMIVTAAACSLFTLQHHLSDIRKHLGPILVVFLRNNMHVHTLM